MNQWLPIELLRKQKLLFFHWHHHALTLCFSWYAYSAGAPSGRHLLYFNAIIHAMMYSYYFLTSLNIRPPLIVSKFITLAEISHFFFIVYMLVHLTMLVYVYQEPCQFDSKCLALTWMMDLSYLYLFIEFYMKNARNPNERILSKMNATEHSWQIKFDAAELYWILTDQEFDRHRAGRWMNDHVVFTFQAAIFYLFTIFALKKWMQDREPFKLQWPVAAWNFTIALVSGVCAAVMTPEFVRNLYELGFSATLCTAREETFSGTRGLALFVLLFARLPEFIDTIFIVLKKQPLLFIHYYHHALTLCFAWSTYSYFTPAMRHPAYVNALIHTVMYSYYFLTTLKIRPPPIVARCITIAQIVQFVYIFYGLAHQTAIIYVFKMPCLQDPTGLALIWFMDLTYLYHRAGRWMDDHVVFTFQAVLLYLATILSLKQWMKEREPFKLQVPVAIWDFSIALVSGVCAAAMTREYFTATFNKGFYGIDSLVLVASRCSTRDTFYAGSNGLAVFVLLFARLSEFIDTLFI
ncbi:hypothetical protein PRIPAC_79814, partial [Pristionchus pacificus]|uniref:Elongation of very long chain fatty acids protein n=1 Tax=Pristionchus pacificus TaxID=54126 RepID=A0A2A6CNN5_PRIPA